MFNIALLGAGRIGQVHAANIAAHPETTLWSVVDPNQENAARLVSQYRTRQQSVNEAMADLNVHAVLIASATDTHADLIELAAKHGKTISAKTGPSRSCPCAGLPKSRERVWGAAVYRF